MRFDEYNKRRAALEKEAEEVAEQLKAAELLQEEMDRDARDFQRWVEDFAGATDGMPGARRSAQELEDEALAFDRGIAADLEDAVTTLDARARQIDNQMEELEAEWRKSSEEE